MSKLEKTKSFCRSGLKKCKSLKELYQQRSVSSSTASSAATAQIGDAKTFQNLDEFERNYLFSAGKNGLVRELRKNFEKQQASADKAHSKATYRKCDFSEITDADVPAQLPLPEMVAAADAKKKRTLNACHSFNVTTTSTNTTTAMVQGLHHRDSPIDNPLCNSEPPSWTQSAMNLSTLVSSSSHTDESSDYSSSEPDKPDGQTEQNNNDLGSAVLLLKNMRNIGHSQHQRANDGDTMSMCDLSMYPVYMHNINDCNSLLATRQSDCGDSGISINNTLNSIKRPSAVKESNATAAFATPAVLAAPSLTSGMMKKYNSVNQINLELLKSELDDFVDIERVSTAAPATKATRCTQSSWNLWGSSPPMHYQQQYRVGRPPYHHRSASSLVSTVQRKVCSRTFH